MWGFPSNNPSVVQDLLRHLVDKIDTNVDVITRYKEHCLDDAEYILVSYGSSARSAIHLAKNRRQKGERLGVLELQSIWPFPAEMVRAKCANAKAVIVVEMNMGQVLTQVKAAVDQPNRVFLANRIDGKLITPSDIKGLLRVIQGKGV
jgi:2-oxoglutarate ferredoxin oxidoreductase subunit alpha